ncbi:hypothetical protein AX279_05640 [Pseudomonas sp. J237]|uniref:CsiV family protein n=1 Tax=Pseudomonas sp. TaxID=306 RepID=UPI000853FAC5|nr:MULTISPECIES: CsiV family protein [Pseudomonas]OEO26308.1 hypothetical protein AX279_05640 [Pseudomonas sp. J237]
MRAFQSAALLALTLLTLASAPVSANDTYKVEVIVFRQPGEPIPSSKLAPEGWSAGAMAISKEQSRETALDQEAAKLSPENGYEVLLHQAWSQPISETPNSVAISNGEQQLGHYPVEGTLTFSQGRTFKVDTQLWVNQFDSSGLVSASEHIKKTGSPVTRGKLTFIDYQSLGILIRIR